MKSPIFGAVDNFLHSLQFASTIPAMDELADLETQLNGPIPAAKNLRVSYLVDEFWLSEPQGGLDFLLGRVDNQTVLVRTSANVKVWGRPPEANQVSFTEVMEQINWPTRLKFNLRSREELGLGYLDGFLRLQSRQGVYWRPLDSIQVLIICPVDNSNLRF